MAEIIATETRIQKLVKQHGINGNHKPLVIICGSDIESRLTDTDNKKATPENRRNFRDIAYNVVQPDSHPNALFTEIFETGGCEEINLTPGTSIEVIENYYAAKEILTALADATNHKLHYGKGHWHHSVKQSGQSLYIQSETTTAFFKAVSRQLFADQIAMPALWVSPSKAERPSGKHKKNAAKYFGISTDDKTRSINYMRMKYADGSPSFEIRISHLAPHLPVLMILNAIEAILLEMQTTPLQDIEPTHPYQPRLEIHTGPGTYLRTIKATIASDTYWHRLAPIAEPLAHALVASYRSFLSKPNNASYPETHIRLTELTRLAGYENHLPKVFEHKKQSSTLQEYMRPNHLRKTPASELLRQTNSL